MKDAANVTTKGIKWMKMGNECEASQFPSDSE
jgi:hypothetical protein